MLSRTLRRTLLDPRYQLPPAFLLPWSAGFATLAEARPDEMRNAITPLSTASSSTTAPLQTNTIVATSITAPPVALSESVRQLLPALRAQRQIYITVHIHGKAYLLTQGDQLRLPFLMKDVEPGDILRLNRALNLGSRDFTLKPGAAPPKLKSGYTGLSPSAQPADNAIQVVADIPSASESAAPHFVPHIAKGKFAYLDERLFVCRALVMGVESEPLRIKEKTKRRQRHVKTVRSKHRYTVLKIKELQVKSLEQIENGEVD
ncbi:hypothetical protein AMS68_002604 [Peltaster fructicola]|uniref:Large ribosomal subunit protein bL21m n=1 Tax=Peltaster fructicola TaxID=286661 RepID=A0A6H0XQQ4_9PEZI|nr:hypothetical protein AMS68_002604 [Peltaster fructicola]